MATPESNLVLINTLKTQVAQILDKSVHPSEMTNVQRKSLEDALFPVINGLRTRKISGGDYSTFETGDIIDHIDENTKTHYAGKVLSPSFSGLADINNRAFFDKYENDKPAF